MSTTPALPLLRRLHPGGWVAAAWCLAVASPSLAVGGHGHPDPGFLAAATALAFAGAALLRRRPLLALALLLVATFAVTDATSAGVQLPLTSLLAVDVALCAVTAAGPHRTARAALLLVLLPLVLHLGMTTGNTFGLTTVIDGQGPATVFTVGPYRLTSGLPRLGVSDEGALGAVIAWLVGRSVRQAREHTAALGAQLAAQAVTAERLRIAREMHDTVAHSMGVIALQAGAARRVIATRPERAEQALGAIETAGRETLAGVRRLLGALREAEAGPGLAELERLAAETTAAGVRVDLHRVGEPGTLAPETELAAFRIVQESLANVVRHAGVTHCRVRVEQLTGGALALEVTDRGRGRGTGEPGYGLTGLRERVALLHGEFEAGPRAGGGFRVAARLPVVEGVR
ncbi:sensor histidine kinase [Kitasatospora sp. NPDC002227]|uniref:sensor histidine kinase n=1 Tax=Kitasatospora sp. NPDC002227 TaxID=3154773 RepID=UPI00332F144A